MPPSEKPAQLSQPAPLSPPAATVTDLTVSLERNGARSEVLRGVSLDVARGEIIGLVGESGSGKSVLALAMMGLLPERSRPVVGGTVRVAGVDMTSDPDAEVRRVRRTELGVIFQDPMTSLNPTMRVGRQITEVNHSRDDAVRIMMSVGIADAPVRFDVYPHELSGGLRQRIMAAIAVAGTPSLIIADEPTTALDVTVQAQVLDLLRQLRREFGCSIVLITHDLAVAAQISDRIAVLYAGRIAELGPTAEVLARPTHPYTVGLLRSRLSLVTPRDRTLLTLRPESATAAERLLGCAYHSRCPLAKAQCGAEQPPLQPVAVDASGAVDAAHERACWRTVGEVRELARPADDGAGHPEARSVRTEKPGATAETASETTAETTVEPTPEPARAPAVRIRQLDVRFRFAGGARGAGVHALRSIDLDVAAGEALSIVGESGSGKSTLLRVIAGLTPATSGAVEIAARGAQMVFQDAGSSLTPWLSVGELLRERLLPLRLTRSEQSARIDAALTSIGLPLTVARARPAQLSGGQRQRVALARATMIPPAVLLCDEPTSALDASLAASVLNLIREMRQTLQMTVIFVTHDLSVARLMGDRMVVMTQGEIVESGTTADVIGRPQHPYTRSLLSAVPEIGVPA